MNSSEFFFVVLFNTLTIPFDFTSAVAIEFSCQKISRALCDILGKQLMMKYWHSIVEIPPLSQTFNWIPFVKFSKIDIWQLHWKTKIILLFLTVWKKNCFYCTGDQKKSWWFVFTGRFCWQKTFKSMAIALRQKVFCIENVTFSIHIDGLDTPPATRLFNIGDADETKEKNVRAWFQNNNEFVWCCPCIKEFPALIKLDVLRGARLRCFSLYCGKHIFYVSLID